MFYGKIRGEGRKKLFSLVRTKIRLAEDAGTLECRPHPLPLVRLLSGLEVNTVEEAGKYREDLIRGTDYGADRSVASSVLQCMDIIEGVKYKYEPAEFMSNIGREGMKKIEDQAKEKNAPLNLLLMTKDAPAGLNVYIGANPPEGVIFLSGVPTFLSTFLAYAFESEYFSQGLDLKNIICVLGRRTLITNAVHHSLGVFGAELHSE